MKRSAKAGLWFAVVLLGLALLAACTATHTDNCVSARFCDTETNALVLKLRCDGYPITHVETDPGTVSMLQSCGDKSVSICEGRVPTLALLSDADTAVADGDAEAKESADTTTDNDTAATADGDTTEAAADADSDVDTTPPPSTKVYNCYPVGTTADGDAE